MPKTVTVLGCGWLGLPLAIGLHQKGIEVFGTTTSPEKLGLIERSGVTAQLLDLADDIPNDIPCLNADVLISAIPPRTHKGEGREHLEEMRQLLSRLKANQKFVYISSTSVYPKSPGEYDENSSINLEITGNPTLLSTENLIKTYFDDSLILRPGGLMGGNRIAGKYFAGKRAPGRLQPVNYIHRDDAIRLIILSLQKGLSGIYNLVAPIHPTREAVYTANSKKYGFDMPEFEGDGSIRIIKGVKIVNRLNYQFSYPDPTNF